MINISEIKQNLYKATIHTLTAHNAFGIHIGCAPKIKDMDYICNTHIDTVYINATSIISALNVLSKENITCSKIEKISFLLTGE